MRNHKKQRIKNLYGNKLIIDSSYCGNDDLWMFPALAMRDVTIPAGTRICQFRIQEKQPKLEFIEVDDLHNENRNGLGSTGA